MNRPPSTSVRPLESDPDVLASFPVMRELRPHLASPSAYLETVRRMGREGGYRLVGGFEGDVLAAVGGFRVSESLSWGRFLYVDDLVTASSRRSTGLGRALMDWLRAHARAAGCVQFHLDSGVQRHGAHRFYLRERMDIRCYHFAQDLG